jgi:hypothetical protein
MRLRPVAERDRALRDFVECVHYLDEETGGFYEPTEPLPVLGIHDDDDEDTSESLHDLRRIARREAF